MSKHKIYCFSNGGSNEWVKAMAMGDDGHVLATHACSSVAFMSHDLGITSDWKHEKYNEHFGVANWELEWVEDPKTHRGLQKAYKINQELRKEAKAREV